MKLFDLLIRYQRFVFAFSVLSVLVGLAAYGTMARQEDPSFPYRFGSLQVVYPGATAHQIEKLITEPLEEELAQVEELKTVKSISRDNVAILTLVLGDTIYDTDTAWDRVRRAMDRAEQAFPEGVSEITLEDRRMAIPTAVLSITGSDDLILLADAADELKQRLLNTPYVSRIEINGSPEKELLIELDSATLNQLGINRQAIVNLLQQRNVLIPGGLVNLGERFIRINTASDLQTIEEIAALPVLLPNGQHIPLQAIANVSMQPSYPLAAQTFHDGLPAVSLGIITKRGQTDTVMFGNILREKVAELKNDFAPLQINETFFQPDFVKERLDDLQENLLVSAGLIAVVVFFALGLRTGILVALVLPVVALITLAVYNLGGGILHQIAVTGIVISLGILVDNAIVIVESIESHLRKGTPPSQAARRAVKQLAMPLFSSTGTTIAAFIPLLLSKGGTADFTRGIPVMIIIALIVSYLISVIVLPLVAFYWLKPGRQRAVPGSEWIARQVVNLHQRSRWIPLFVVAGLLTFSIALLPQLKAEFFPGADRSQIVLDLELPPGTPVSHTLNVSEQLEQRLRDRDDVVAVMRSAGMSGFRFFYNLSAEPSAPHRARLMVNTVDATANADIIQWVDNQLQKEFTEANLVAKLLGQGPPIVAPIEIRLQHRDPQKLFSATQIAMAALHRVPGTRKVRSNLDQGIPEIVLDIEDFSAEELGFHRAQLAAEVFGQTRGLDSGEFRYSNNPVTMRVRSEKGDATQLSEIPSLYLYNNQQPVPLESMAAIKTRWAAAEIHHYNNTPTVTLLSELQPEASFNNVLADFHRELIHTPLPEGVNISMGGNAEGSDDANRAILQTAPLGIIILLFFMMLQFNSFRRLGIILTTIPLAAIGIVPGLVFSGESFGFQPLLGVIALIGIVVNNAIVLIDVVDSELKSGKKIRDAVNTAIYQRTAPIILTTTTTILGLLPLALSDSTLWPPMAWAIISGLAMSTVLTLIVIPSLCNLLLGDAPKFTGFGKNSKAAPTLLIAGLITLGTSLQSDNAFAYTSSSDASLTLEQALEQVDNNAMVKSQGQQTLAAEQRWLASKRKAFFPTLTLGGEQAWRQEDKNVSFPAGKLTSTEDSAYVVKATLTQPLFSASDQIHQINRHKQQHLAAVYEEQDSSQEISYSVILHYVTVLKYGNAIEENKTLLSAIEKRKQISHKQVAKGIRLQSDVLQLQVAIKNIEKTLVNTQQLQWVHLQRLSQLLDKDLNDPQALALDKQRIQQFITRSGVANHTLKKTTNLSKSTCDTHPKCQQINANIRATQSQKNAISQSRLPNFSLVLEQQESEGHAFVAESDTYLAIKMEWRPFAGGSISKQKQALVAEQSALQEQQRHLQTSLQVDVIEASAQWKVANAQERLAASSLMASEERLRLVRQRYDQGLHTLDDLLDAEADYSRDKIGIANADLDKLLAAAQWTKAKGESYMQWTQL